MSVVVFDSKQGFEVAGDVVAVDEAYTEDHIDPHKPHCYAGLKFYSDAQGTNEVTPTGGTVPITVKTRNSGYFEAPPSNTIDATAPTTVNWAANTAQVRATPSGITGATHYRMTVTCNPG